MRIIPRYQVFLFFVFLTGICLFGIFRLVLLLICRDQLQPGATALLGYVFINRGLLFDTVTVSYLIALPFIFFSLSWLFNYSRPWITRLNLLLICLLFVIAVFISLADIPYFLFYNARVNKGIFDWTDDLTTMFKAVLLDYHYLPYLVAFPLLMYLLIKLLFFLSGRIFRKETRPVNFLLRFLSFAVFTVLLFFGIRGEYDLNARPLLIEHAFVTPYPFINQLGLNPVFNFFQSLEAYKVNEIPDDQAIVNMQGYLGIKAGQGSPVARFVTDEPSRQPHNVVLILVESLSASKIGRFNPQAAGMTPFLDSLAQHCFMFDSVYSAGEHTYNGVFSTLYGLPALLRNKPTTSSFTASLKYSGLPNILQARGYTNIFFCPNAKEFDNLEGFLLPNGFAKVFDEKGFPASMTVNGWGVSDHYLYDFALPRMDSLSAAGKPFFVTVLTIATHSPYKVPKNLPINYVTDNPLDRSYEYTDWALKRFFQAASGKAWYKNTVFAIVGDHGQNFDKTYEMPLSYHHTPLYIYCPWAEESRIYGKMGLQIDLTPTLLDLLQFPYLNNTLGIDLFRETRPYSFFSGDTRMGCLDHKYYYIRSQDGREALFQYRNKSLANFAVSEQAKLKDMKKYLFSNLQVTQYMIRKRQTGIGN